MFIYRVGASGFISRQSALIAWHNAFKDFVVRNWISLRHHSIVIYTILQVKWQRIKYFDTLKLLPAIAEHFRGPERLRGRATVPGGTIPLADTFRGNKYASGFVPPEQWRGGTNPL